MDTILIIFRLLLVLVFFVAGFAKLVDRVNSRKSLANFGVSAPLVAPLGIVLPSAELAVAIALISSSYVWWGAAGATALLAVFTLGIAINLARGNRPACHCFGQLHSAPVGGSTLLRNGVLLMIAVFLLVQGQRRLAASSMSDLVSFSDSSGSILIIGSVVIIALFIQGWLLVHLMRQNGRLLLRMDELEARLSNSSMFAPSYAGLPLGSSAPNFKLSDLNGNLQTLDDFIERKKAVILIFSDPNCEPCSALLPAIGEWQQRHADILSFALLSRGTIKENRAKTSKQKNLPVLLQTDREVSQSYLAQVTPSAVLVFPNGTIGSPLAIGKEAIESLVTQTTQPPAPPAGLPIGSEAPNFTLFDLEDNRKSLSEFRGHRILLIFFNPRCGYCVRMAPDLANLPTDGVAEYAVPLVVTSGSAEDNRQLVEQYMLRCPVLLQRELEVATTYQAGGTPMGYLIDEHGHIASELLSGAQALLNAVAPPMLVAGRNRD